MKAAMIAPVGMGDAIAEYARELASGLASLPDTEAHIVALPDREAPSKRNATADYAALAETCNAPEIDVVHLHHAHRLFGEIAPGRYTFWELRYLLKKPIVITAHDTRSLEELLAARSEVWWQRLRQRRWLTDDAFRDSVEIAPFVTALTILHTAWERQTLIQRGAKSGYLTIIPPGVADLASAPHSHTLTDLPETLESGIKNTREARIAEALPSLDDPYAVERELAQHHATLAPDTPTTREIIARIPCLELYSIGEDENDRQVKYDALLSDAAKREKLAVNARRYAQRFAWPRVAALTRSVYRDAIEIFNSGPHHGLS